MALKDLLVVLDDGKAAAGRLDYAVAFAGQCEAHLTGLYVAPESEIPGYVMAQLPTEVRAIQTEEAARKRDAVRSQFEEVTTRAGWQSRSQWMAGSGDPAEQVALIGRYADLVIVGQDDLQPEGSGVAIAADVVLSGGRPVMVVPHAFRAPDAIGQHVLVAWNGSREAARAIGDAMPILESARQVTVLTVDPDAALGAIPGADIATHLARHGINVEAARMGSEGLDIADILLNRVTDLGVDMIVMGAYGRSRWRELVLGGATRDILHRMTVPALMSH